MTTVPVRGVWLIAVLCGCTGATTHTTPKLPWPGGDGATRLDLGNGATAILLPDPDADVATVLVRYQVGAIDDPPGSEGLADLASHVSYDQSAGRHTVWDELDHVAIGIDDMPGESATELEETTTADHLHEVMVVEAQRLQGACTQMQPRDFAYAQRLVRDEVASPSWTVKRTLRHALVPDGDPGQRRFDATPDSVSALTAAKVCEFIASHYVPSNLTVVVSGPVSADAFERLATDTIGGVHARSATPQPKLVALTPAAGSLKVPAGIGTPAAMIAWPLPGDRAERVRTIVAARVLATLLDLEYLVEDRLVLLGNSEPKRGVDDLIARVTATLGRNAVSHDELARAIEGRRAFALARYDDPPSRVRVVADPDAAANLDAVMAMTPEVWTQIATTTLAWSHARVVVLQPDGTHPHTHALDLGERAHPLRTLRETKEAGLAIPRSSVLAHARTFKLDTGLTVVLARTTVVPVIDVELVFGAGETDEDHVGAARVAIRALDAVAHRGVPDDAVADSSAVAFEDWSAIRVYGEARQADALIRHFGGLSGGAPTADELALARKEAVERNPSVVGRLRFDWDHAVRAALYGTDHPDAKLFEPTKTDVANVDAGEVAAFTAKLLRSSNATLVITGGFDAATVEKLVRATFASWRDDGSPVQHRDVAAHGTPSMLAVEDKSLELYVDVSWRADPGDDTYATRILVGSSLASQASRVDSGFEWRRDGGRYRLTAQFPADKTDAIGRLFHDLPGVNPDHHLSPGLFASDRRRVVAARASGRHDAESWALALADAYTHGHDAAWLSDELSRFAHVKYDDADALARRELATDRMVWLVAGPHDAVAAAFAAMGVQPQWVTP